MVMRLVLDTNLLVSALLKPASVPDRALAAVWSRGAVVLYDARIEDEYRTVLMRPKFRAIDRQRIDDFFTTLAARGEKLADVPRWNGAMKDDDDRIFIEVALAGRAEAIVTGNIRDYPTDLGFDVHPPATLLAMLE
jgi:putative PIN family toxin of toxin-antitoxin system